MPDISDSIKRAVEILKHSGIVEARKEANSLLSLALQKDRAFLIAHSEYELTETELDLFVSFIKRRSRREPYQHIAGKQEFYGLDFYVSPDVLIPRSETELIVENAIDILRDFENPSICEIGIGSGCISVSILHEVKEAKAIGIDISEKALQIAKQNAFSNGVLERLQLQTSDIFEVLGKEKQFDLIVSNPPYIPQKDIPTLQAEVRDYDPHIALTDGKDGLSIVELIIKESPKYLKNSGYLLMEIGFSQSEKVRKMFDPNIWQNLEFLTDLQGIPRMVKSKKLKGEKNR